MEKNIILQVGLYLLVYKRNLLLPEFLVQNAQYDHLQYLVKILYNIILKILNNNHIYQRHI